MYSNSVLVKNMKKVPTEVEGQHAVQKTPPQLSQVVMTR